MLQESSNLPNFPLAIRSVEAAVHAVYTVLLHVSVRCLLSVCHAVA